MAGPTNLRLLTDFFNKIGQTRTSEEVRAASDHPSIADIKMG